MVSFVEHKQTISVNVCSHVITEIICVYSDDLKQTQFKSNKHCAQLWTLTLALLLVLICEMGPSQQKLHGKWHASLITLVLVLDKQTEQQLISWKAHKPSHSYLKAPLHVTTRLHELTS